MAKKKQRDVDAELRAFLGGDRVEIGKTLRAIQPTDDVELAVLAIHAVMGHGFVLAHHGARLPVSVIRAVLAKPSKQPMYTFLRLAVPDDPHDGLVSESWTNALQALLDLQSTYAWGSSERRSIFQGLARDSRLLQAIQGTVANTQNASMDMLAVLVTDGSDVSYDALIPHIDPAIVGADGRLDRLMRLKTHARRTPLLDAFFDELGDARDQRDAQSPALTLGPVIGIGLVDPLWFTFWLRGRMPGRYQYRVEARIAVDSRKERWFSVQVSGRTYTSFGVLDATNDHLEIGTCEALDLPTWLANTAQTLALVSTSAAFWNVADVLSGLPTEGRDRVAAWLTGR